MLNRFFGSNTHTYLHILGVSGIAAGLPLNKVVMSISMMFVILNLVLEADFKSYFINLKSNKIFLLVLVFFLFHVVALSWSNNLDSGFNDLRVKLPLLVILVALTVKPIRATRHLEIVLALFLSSLVITSLLNFGFYQHWIGSRNYDDIRGMSLFCSHVRYALLISMGVGISLLHNGRKTRNWIVIRLALVIWFIFYTYYSQVLSGFLSLGGVFAVAVVYWLWDVKKWIAISSLVLISAISIFLTLWILQPIAIIESDYVNLTERTAEGNLYQHQLIHVSPETKKPIEIFICEIELEREWNKVSKIPFDGRDIKGQLIKTTLIRYLASMDVNKDAIGFQNLTQQDIRNIEKGCASIYCNGLMARAYGLKFQLNNVKDPNGHSLLQRFEFWKAGIVIAKNNLLFGVGTGDVQDEFNLVYEYSDSPLTIENRKRTHNMYLTVLLTFGILGLFLFIWLHTEFFFNAISQRKMVGVAFIVIILLSYLIEDTLETQTGITYFALFLGLYNPSKK